MYVPNHFREDDSDELRQLIQEHSFGLLIVADEEGIEANHLPFHLSYEGGEAPGSLRCHVARSNPVWKRLQDGAKVLVVFQGPDGYVSPSWYATKSETGRVVPTWNYVAVHAEGQARVIEDSAWLHQLLRDLTNRHESGRSEPWGVEDAPADFTEGLVRAIVGIEVSIETLIGKVKASQNQPERNRAGVKAGLEREETEARCARSMSDFVHVL
ncbi:MULTISPECIES: FMN-binding negative transcriptional regulator [Marinobacter]|uniref:FMN-binding negative transcriptional regulator n=1 Tax=Marinobacter suaedae TaxID=3057675 RepID=A0ABT8VXN9_9GAMM|nr:MULTISPECIES: FMN-binding negative transcriptional regulator [unclassified Marinobacter]MBZ2168830.1 FMN-binding negative transcriptional regulator [Marinobacter sp. F4216]MDO3720705.1 FMN-binding negative transcriptional regulator [Marinobacter sp. chi1]